MKDNPRQQFRWAPHVSGAASVKTKDYEPSGEVEADNEYAAWALLRDSETPLMVGDLLELEQGQLRICKYVGFDEARWLIQEKPVQEMLVEEKPVPDAPAPANVTSVAATPEPEVAQA